MISLLKNLGLIGLSLLLMTACGPSHEDNRYGSIGSTPGSGSDPADEDPIDDTPPDNVVVPATVDFEFLRNNVFNKAAYNCVGCHAGNDAFDFDDLATVETALAKGEDMSGLGRDELAGNIFFVKTLEDYGDDAVFGGARMPLGGGAISVDDRELIQQWVEAGGDI